LRTATISSTSGIQGRATAVDDALPADLDHRRFWQDPEVLRRLHRLQKPRVGQRSLHEERLELRRIGHGNTFRRFRELLILSSDVVTSYGTTSQFAKFMRSFLQKGKNDRKCKIQRFSSVAGIEIDKNPTAL
jgi:hypothetical protein